MRIKGRLAVVSCVVLFGTALFFKDDLLARTAEVYILRSNALQNVKVASFTREKNTLVFQDVSYQDPSGAVFVEKVQALFHLSLLPLHCEIQIDAPKMQVEVASEEGGENPLLALFAGLQTRLLDIRICVDHGVIKGVGDNPYSFSFSPQKGMVGVLKMQDSLGLPFIQASLAWKDRHLHSLVEIEKADIQDLLSWTSLFQSGWDKKWQDGKGKISALLDLVMHPKKGLQALQGKVSAEELFFCYPELETQCFTHALQGTFSFAADHQSKKPRSIWKNLELFLTFEDASIFQGSKDARWGMENTLGEIRLAPSQNPYMKVGGSLLSGGCKVPFSVEAEEKKMEDALSFMEAKAEFFEPFVESSELTFFVHHKEKNTKQMQLQATNITTKVFNFLQKAGGVFGLPQYVMNTGNLSGSWKGSWENGSFHAMDFSDCFFKNCSFSCPSQNLDIAWQDISCHATLKKSPDKFWQVNTIDLSLEKLNGFLDHKPVVASLSTQLKGEDGVLSSSYVEFEHEGIWAAASLLKEEEGLVHLEARAHAQDVIAKLWKEQNVLQEGPFHPVFLSADVVDKEGKMQGKGSIRLLSPKGIEEEIEVEMVLPKKISRQMTDVFSRWDFSSYRGSFSTEKLSSETVAIWLKPWMGSLSLEALLHGKGVFDEKGMSIEASLEEFELIAGPWNVSGKLGTEESVQIFYEKQDGLWKGTVPVDLLCLKNSALKLETKVEDSCFFFEGDQLWTDQLQADVEGAKLLGSLFASTAKVSFVSKSFEGSISSLKPIASQFFPSLALNESMLLEGSFYVGERSCFFEANKEDGAWRSDWKVSLGLKHVSWDVKEQGLFHDIGCAIEANSKGEYAIKNLQGVYTLSKASCPFSLRDFYWDGSKSIYNQDFFLLAKEGKREWVYLQGNIEKQGQGNAFKVSLAPHCHLLGLPLQITPWIVQQGKALSPLHVSSFLQLDKLPAYLSMWKDMGIEVPTYPWMKSLQGKMRMQALYDLVSHRWKASLESADLVCQQKNIGKMQIALNGDLRSLSIDTCQIGPYGVKGLIEKIDSHWSIPSLALEWPEGKCRIQGKYTPKDHHVQIPIFSLAYKQDSVATVQLQGSFEGKIPSEEGAFQGRGVSRAFISSALGVSIESKKEVPFLVHSQLGLSIEKGEWDIKAKEGKKEGSVSIKNMQYLFSEQKLSFQDAFVCISKEGIRFLRNLPQMPLDWKKAILDQDVELQANGEISPLYRKIAMNVKNGSCAFLGSVFDVKYLQMLLEQDTVYASCSTKYQEEPLWLHAQMGLGPSASLSLAIKENPEKKGIVLSWKQRKEGWSLDHAQGSCKGLSLDLKKKKDKHMSQAYDVQAKVDFTALSPFFPKNWQSSIQKWGLGEGYSFHGLVAFDPVKPLSEGLFLQGDLSCRHFALLGKMFSLLQAKLEWSKEKGKIHALSLEDEAALLSIKTIDITYDPSLKDWMVSSPIVSVKNFIPSYFGKDKKGKGIEIKNLSLQEVKGKLSDMESFQAKGALYFTSQEKKTLSFWDVPLEMIKDWGIDPGILTPETGEADFELHQGKVYFTALRNVYSAGKRSQFYLAKDPRNAYLSLDGQWHLDLAMKQNVVWKVTEDLILSIRGTVEKPKYSFSSHKDDR